MSAMRKSVTRDVAISIIAALMCAVASSCFAGYWSGSDDGGTAKGEEHEVNFSSREAFVLTQDVLRGEGILFDLKPENQIISIWKPADTPASVWASLAGLRPQYRYEIQVIPEAGNKSKIVANVRTMQIADNEIDNYLPSRKLNLFKEFDQLAATLPPSPSTPRTGGVNFALLPGETLIDLSRRVTGNPDNWQRIAQDNGLKSPNDTQGVQSIWVSDALLPANKAPQTSVVPADQ